MFSAEFVAAWLPHPTPPFPFPPPTAVAELLYSGTPLRRLGGAEHLLLGLRRRREGRGREDRRVDRDLQRKVRKELSEFEVFRAEDMTRKRRVKPL